VLAALALGVGCAFFTSKEDERRAGAEMAKEVKTQIGLYRAPAREWVADVGKRLVAHLRPEDQRDWDFRFDIVDELEPNAFALPGGPIYVSRGLLPLIVEEDDLACILGHEISHVTERHATRREERAILPGILTLPGRLVGIVSAGLGDLVAAPFEIVGRLNLARYSRQQEADADELGAALAARSGYDPRALARVLDRLEKDATRLMGKEHQPSFFDDHPDTPTRIEEVDAHAATLRWSKEVPIRGRDSIVVVLNDTVWGVNPAQGVFEGELFLHPDLGFAVRFPRGWRRMNGASAVGAIREHKAEVVVSVSGSNRSPAAEGHELSRRLRADGVVPDEEGSVVVHGNPGYYLHLVDGDLDAALLWVEIGTTTYRIVGVGDWSDRPAITASLMSMRPITEEERESIHVVRIHPAETRAGETLATLGARAGNDWTPAYTALVNGLPEGAPLGGGALVKIARRERYVAASSVGLR
jgi:predicted Zn-dependent protease